MTHSSNLYIAIEGIDGTGKTHVVNFIADKYKLLKVQEPSVSEIGRIIVNGKWDPLTDFFLFMADRANTLRSLRTESNFISDRSLYSSYAYQGVYLIEKFNSFDDYFNFFKQTGMLLPRIPDFVFVLYSDVDLAMTRLGKRESLSRFEMKEFLENVQNMYFKLQGRIKNLKFIDSNPPLEKLIEKMDAEIRGLLQQGHPL